MSTSLFLGVRHTSRTATIASDSNTTVTAVANDYTKHIHINTASPPQSAHPVMICTYIYIPQKAPKPYRQRIKHRKHRIHTPNNDAPGDVLYFQTNDNSISRGGGGGATLCRFMVHTYHREPNASTYVRYLRIHTPSVVYINACTARKKPQTAVGIHAEEAPRASKAVIIACTDTHPTTHPVCPGNDT